MAESKLPPGPWRVVKDLHPGRHRKHVVLRDGILFTATPCYGMHEPWWVVKIMGPGGEADPVPMLPEDAWRPREEALALVDGGR